MLKKLTALAALLAAMVVVGSCGNDQAPQQPTQAAARGSDFNDADVEFATDMIQHHAEALSMVDVAAGRQLDQEVRRLAEDIREVQGPEIEQMTDWLTDWDQPIPETMRDHANAHGSGEMDMQSDRPGTISAEDMVDLEAAQGEDFQRMWLELMIEHHEGAIEMARTEQSDGEFGPAVELAKNIESAQQDELSTLESLLGS